MELNGAKFHQWIHCQIELNKFHGLHWCDKSKGLFRIPWNKNVEDGERELLKAYAEFRNKHIGRDDTKLKALFRSALNKCAYLKCDFIEKDKQCKNFRIYKFLSKKEMKDERIRERMKKKKDSSDQSTSPESVGSPVCFQDLEVESILSRSLEADRETGQDFSQDEMELPELSGEEVQQICDESPDVLELLLKELDQTGSLCQNLYVPQNPLHENLLQNGVNLKDTGKFIFTAMYRGVIVKCQLMDLSEEHIWIMYPRHGEDSFNLYKQILAYREHLPPAMVCDLFKLPKPERMSQLQEEIMDKGSLGFFLEFEYSSLTLFVTRLSQSRIFASTFEVDVSDKEKRKLKRFEKRVPVWSFECSLGENAKAQCPNIEKRMGIDFNIGTMDEFPDFNVRVQSALTNYLGFCEKGFRNDKSGTNPSFASLKTSEDVLLSETFKQLELKEPQQ